MPRDAADAEPDPTELDLGWNLSVLFRAYLTRANAVFDDLPGGPRAYQLLASVERGAATSQLALARRLGIDRTVMTYLIDDLVEADLVERRTDPDDRRARTIVATTRGRRLLPDLDRRLARIEQGLLGGLTADDAQRLRRLLRKAAAGLDAAEHPEDPRDITRAMSRPRPSRGSRQPSRAPRPPRPSR